MAGIQDINSGYIQDVSGIPSAYTTLLQQLGYIPVPFQTQNQAFLSEENFQRLLKQQLDAQLNAFGNNAPGGNLAYLPRNLQNIYSMAAPALTDPMYGIIGAPGFFSGGYKLGDLPSGHSAAYGDWLDSLNTPPPIPSSSGGNGGGGGGGNHSNTNQYTVGLNGGGSITVNASSPQAAIDNANAQTGQKSNGRVSSGSYQF